MTVTTGKLWMKMEKAEARMKYEGNVGVGQQALGG